MKNFTLLRVEAGRMLRSRKTWIAVALTAMSPAVGLRLYRPLNDYSVNGTVIGNLALAGALCGAIVFAVLAAGSFNYRRRFGVEAITDVIYSPVSLAITQTFSLLFIAAIAQR